MQHRRFISATTFVLSTFVLSTPVHLRDALEVALRRAGREVFEIVVVRCDLKEPLCVCEREREESEKEKESESEVSMSPERAERKKSSNACTQRRAEKAAALLTSGRTAVRVRIKFFEVRTNSW